MRSTRTRAEQAALDAVKTWTIASMRGHPKMGNLVQAMRLRAFGFVDRLEEGPLRAELLERLGSPVSAALVDEDVPSLAAGKRTREPEPRPLDVKVARRQLEEELAARRRAKAKAATQNEAQGSPHQAA
jgi:hypothetical protein